MQLYDQAMEERCIMTLTRADIPETVRSTLLGKLSKEFFHYPPCLAAFTRVDTLAKKRFIMVDFEELMSDPALDEDARDILRDSTEEPVRNKKKLRIMLDLLDSYRKIRIVYDLANKALDKIEGENVDIDKLLGEITNSLTNAQRNVGEEDAFVHFGKNGNAKQLIHDTVYKVAEQLTKTGFTEFDERNGGLPEEGVMLIAATTSGGKSVMLLKLLVNLYLLSKKKVGRISLEMGDIQESRRLSSMLSGVPFWKIKQNKTSPKEKERMLKALNDFYEFGEKNDCCFSSLSPTRGMSIDDALRVLKPFGFDAVGIDYASLLDGVDEDNQWKVLSAIIRKCKIFSREAKCLVIVLCQLDTDSDKIRYSRGMKEHADVVWQWNYSKKEQRELKLLPIDVTKARDGELIGFNLGERFDVMNVENLAGDGSLNSYSSDEDDQEDEIPKKKKKKKTSDDGIDVSSSKKKKKRSLDDEDKPSKKKKKRSLDDGDGVSKSYALQ